jgi:hypothetical protein
MRQDQRDGVGWYLSLAGFAPESASVLDQARDVRWTRKAVFHTLPRSSFLSF